MIIDVHTHTPTHKGSVPADEMQHNDVWRPDAIRPVTFGWDDFIDEFEAVDRAIVFNMALHPKHRPNDATAEFVSAYPDKLIGFMSVHPHDDDMRREMERSLKELGLRGIKLGPNYQVFDPLEPRAMDIYAQAQQLGLPILFHQGASGLQTRPLRYTHPLYMDEIATAFPDLRIVMAHMGHPWQADCITVIRKHPNVYADVSGLFYRPLSFYQCMRLAIEWNVAHKLLFASDFPVTTPSETIEALRNVNDIVEGTKFPTVPQEAIEGIIHRDALTLLGLE